MQMDIVLFIEILGNTQLRYFGTNIADSCLGRFLHDVAKLTGNYDLAGSLYNNHFNLKRFAANRSPGKPIDKAYLLDIVHSVPGICQDSSE